jgi:hypothetical protein
VFTAIDGYSNEGKQDHAKEKSDKDLFQYVPIEFLHAACKGNKYR